MPKVRSSVASRKRRQRTLKAARGYFEDLNAEYILNSIADFE